MIESEFSLPPMPDELEACAKVIREKNRLIEVASVRHSLTAELAALNREVDVLSRGLAQDKPEYVEQRAKVIDEWQHEKFEGLQKGLNQMVGAERRIAVGEPELEALEQGVRRIEHELSRLTTTLVDLHASVAEGCARHERI